VGVRLAGNFVELRAQVGVVLQGFSGSAAVDDALFSHRIRTTVDGVVLLDYAMNKAHLLIGTRQTIIVDRGRCADCDSVRARYCYNLCGVFCIQGET
jgi:hypothetical protein